MNETKSRRVAQYHAAQRREAKKRKRKRKRQIIFLFLILVGILCYYYKNNTDNIEVEVSQYNTQREFLTLDQVKNQLTPDMYTREVAQSERDRLSDFCNTHSEMSDKIGFLSNNLSAYPSYVVSSLLSSPDKIDYILSYPIMKGTPAINDITINVEKGKLPYLLQWDSRWGYAPYGDSIGFCGCAPTCLSMVAIGLTGNTGCDFKFCS